MLLKHILNAVGVQISQRLVPVSDLTASVRCQMAEPPSPVYSDLSCCSDPHSHPWFKEQKEISKRIAREEFEQFLKEDAEYWGYAEGVEAEALPSASSSSDPLADRPCAASIPDDTPDARVPDSEVETPLEAFARAAPEEDDPDEARHKRQRRCQ